MKQILLLIFFPAIVSGQITDKSAAYKIDLLKSDSFYLVELYRATGNDKARSDTLLIYTLFSDTSEFRRHIDDMDRYARRLERQYLPVKMQYDSVCSRTSRLKILAFDTFGMNISGNIENREISAQAAQQSGFWVLYPPDAHAEYIFNLDEIRGDALILNPNGTSMLFASPKKPAKIQKSKSKNKKE